MATGPNPSPLYDVSTLWELVRRRAEATPDAPMLFDESERTLTFGEFAAKAERVAAGLMELGVGPGSSVTWQLPTRIETVILSMALARLGAVQNPIIHIYREREVGFAVRQTSAELVVVPGTWRGFDYLAMAERIAGALPNKPRILVAYDDLPDGDPAGLPPAPTSADDVRWIYYTSGTTSDPKGVRHSDGTLLAGGIGLAVAMEMSPADVGSIAFPFAHIGGPDYLVTMLTQGFPAILIEAFDPVTVVDVLNRVGATMAGGSTAFYSTFLSLHRAKLASGDTSPLVPTLRVLSGGGAPKPPEIFFEVKREMGVVVAHGYGMTEVPMITQNSPHDTDDQLAYSEGAPVRGTKLRIVDEAGNDAKPGTEGEVRLSGPIVFHGYTDPELNAAAFDEQGYFRTGDLGVQRQDGHVTLTGRLKDVIIRKGENISAKEIEDLLYEHPLVANVAVIGLPDSERGERVCAVVESVPDGPSITFPEMSTYLREHGLMTQKIPEQLEIIDVMPRNATLKILKHELRARYK
ncbi:MAG TPA: AMP-binding protein [Frankiaceae bacterium]|nr:AMP-binding protein [Frankiaceae bacterium]